MRSNIIYVDSRVGSKELAPVLHDTYGIRVRVEALDYADFAFLTCPGFQGREEPSVVGVERKTLSDLISSLLKNRLSKQVTGMLEGYDICWLLVEGQWRPATDDAIEVPMVRREWVGRWMPVRGPLTYSALQGWLTRYDVLGGGKIRRDRTADIDETAAWIAAKFRWCNKPWHKHQSMTVEKMAVPDKALLFRPTNIMRTAASLPGVGSTGARRVGSYFRSIHEMVNADEEEWIEALRHRATKPRELRTSAKEVWQEIRRRYR